MRAASPLPDLVPQSKRSDAVSRFLRALRERLELQPKAAAALDELRRQGVRAEVVGSFAWGGYSEGSDVDFLVLDAGKLSDGRIYEIVSRHLGKKRFDVVHQSQMSSRPGAFMARQREARGQSPL
jgi:predicted nucleotidyltransferase